MHTHEHTYDQCQLHFITVHSVYDGSHLEQADTQSDQFVDTASVYPSDTQ